MSGLSLMRKADATVRAVGENYAERHNRFAVRIAVFDSVECGRIRRRVRRMRAIQPISPYGNLNHMSDPATTRSKAIWLVPSIALCLAVIVAFAWPSDVTDAPTNLDRTDLDGNGSSSASQQAGDNSTAEIEPAVSSGGDRVPVPELIRTTAPDSSSEPQGLRGTTVDANGRPLMGVTIYLVESASNDPILLHLVQQQPHLLAPMASAETGQDGTFAVGLPVAQNKTYDLFLLSRRHATVRITGLRLLKNSWHDLGDLILRNGTTIRGRVTIKGQFGMPVPQATVTVSSGGAFADAALRALPGESGTLMTNVNANGEYELKHAPASGVVLVTALAPGFARIVKQDIELNSNAPVQVDFELPPGKTLAGDVRTSTGLAISNARIEAWPKQANLPPLVTFSDERGAFLLQGLRAQPHTVKATAPGFAATEQSQVQPGQAVHLTMVPQNRIHVTALAPTGRVLRKYRVGLRRFFPKDLNAPLDAQALATGTLGSIHEVRDLRVRLDGNTDFAVIHNVPDGTYVCVVQAEGFAKSYSLPLRFRAPQLPGAAPGTPTPQQPGTLQRTEVTVTAGSSLRGRVIDSRGAPIVGATVITQSPGTMPDSPMLRMMDRWTPKRITEGSRKTDSNGFFQFERMALTTYQLQIDHPQACRVFVKQIDCKQPIQKMLPPITMIPGSVVTGFAMTEGRIAGQMKVLLTTPQATPADKSLRLETVTDGEGRYRFTRRIPPGSYELHAAVVGSTSPDSEIFQQLLQLKRSSTTFFVPAGQDVVEHDVNVPAAN
ncbi:MAG: protocatechuate 3,4-dioxygenase beta subunit [Neolewinella sp.]|jgi:protocatechuate 3,4-dioxygenase beta subunit